MKRFVVTSLALLTILSLARSSSRNTGATAQPVAQLAETYRDFQNVPIAYSMMVLPSSIVARPPEAFVEQPH
jgi:hypothetical protein